MTVDDLKRLFDYSYWANARMFEVVSKLTQDQFVQPVAGSYGSVRNTLVHMLSAEWGWLSRCGGSNRGNALKPDDYPTVGSLQATWSQVERDMRDFLSKLKDADLHRMIEFALPDIDKRSMPLGELVHHAFVHGVHHRGQIAVLLRGLGFVPGNFDILVYYGNQRGRSA